MTTEQSFYDKFALFYNIKLLTFPQPYNLLLPIEKVK